MINRKFCAVVEKIGLIECDAVDKQGILGT